jgi:MFS family permease
VSESTASSAPPSLRVALLLGGLVALTVIGSSAVAVAIPVLAADLGLDTSGSAWILAAFSLTFAIGTAVFGRLADLVGLRLPLRIGGALFALGSLTAALATSFPMLIAGRLVQGAGAGAVPVLVVGIIAVRFDEAYRSRALGTITAVVIAVSGSGPLIGGGLTELISWRAVLALPVVAVLLTEPVARLAPPGVRMPGGMDIRGAVLVAVAVSGGALLLQSPATGAGPAAVLGFGLLLVAGLGLLVGHVARRPDGFLPRAVVTTWPLMAGSLAGMTLLAAYIALLFAVPTLLTAERGWTPLQVGLAMLPAAALGAVASRVVGTVATPTRRHRIVVALALGSAGGLALAAVLPEAPLALVAGLGLSAGGFAGGQVAIIDAVPALVAPEHRGVALGVFNLLFFIGGTIGAAAVGGLSGPLGIPGALGALAVLPVCGALLGTRLRAAGTPCSDSLPA